MKNLRFAQVKTLAGRSQRTVAKDDTQSSCGGAPADTDNEIGTICSIGAMSAFWNNSAPKAGDVRLFGVEPAELYENSRAQLLELAESMTARQAEAFLAATPPWTVTDGYRHLAGVCADFLDGVLEGAGGPEWTAVQVASRQSRSLSEVCTEWAERAPVLETQMASAGPTMAFLAFDVWTHEQDIRAALGLRGNRNDDRVAALAALALQVFDARYEASGSPALLVLVDGQPHVLGPLGADAEITLGTSAYELLRILFGRRSASQIAAANWTGETGSVISALHIFDLPINDIVD